MIAELCVADFFVELFLFEKSENMELRNKFKN